MSSPSPQNKLQIKEQAEIKKLLTNIYISKAMSSRGGGIAAFSGLSALIEKAISQVFDQNGGEVVRQKQIEQLKEKLEMLILASKNNSLPESLLTKQNSLSHLQLPKIINNNNSNNNNNNTSPMKRSFNGSLERKDQNMQVEEENPNPYQEVTQNQSQSESLHNSPLKTKIMNRQRTKTIMLDIEGYKRGRYQEEAIEVKKRNKHGSLGNDFFIKEVENTDEYLQKNKNDIWTLIAKYNDQRGQDDKKTEEQKSKQKMILMKRGLDEQMKEKEIKNYHSLQVEAGFIKMARDGEAQMKEKEDMVWEKEQKRRKKQVHIIEEQLKEQKEERKIKLIQMRRDNDFIKEEGVRNKEQEAEDKRKRYLQKQFLYDGIRADYFNQFGKIEQSDQVINQAILERKRVITTGKMGVNNSNLSMPFPTSQTIPSNTDLGQQPSSSSNTPSLLRNSFHNYGKRNSPLVQRGVSPIMQRQQQLQQSNLMLSGQESLNYISQLENSYLAKQPVNLKSEKQYSEIDSLVPERLPKTKRETSEDNTKSVMSSKISGIFLRRPKQFRVATESDKVFNLPLLKEIDSYISSKKAQS